MFISLVYYIELILYIISCISTTYIVFFVFISLFPRKKDIKTKKTKNHRFIIIFPAYGEDSVIINSVSKFLEQQYEPKNYKVVVVSDHMTDSTNQTLCSFPIATYIATYPESSKAKALQLAMSKQTETFDYVVILDADNVVAPDFLNQLNELCSNHPVAIQTHRCAKNINTATALLDAISEEINNTIFRKSHNKIGLASALIGSGMCFDFEWFKTAVNNLTSAGEDKELEAALLYQGHHIVYAEHIYVQDEKVQSVQNFQNQRRRWLAAQFWSFGQMCKKLPHALIKGNWNYIDKTIQQILLPRSLVLAINICMAILTTLCNAAHSTKWWILFAVTVAMLAIATPKTYRNKRTIKAFLQLPLLVFMMLFNLFNLKGAAKNFLHTQHGENTKEK